MAAAILAAMIEPDRTDASVGGLGAEVAAALAPHGLIVRGAFPTRPEDGLTDAIATVVLIGNAGPAMWHAFAADRPAGPDPLDRWTRRVVDPVAARFAARAVYPFDGPPYPPFQRWAARADDVHRSPLGLLIHPRFGLWHAYRAALLTSEPVPWAPGPRTRSPCETCIARPCLDACPVGAFGETYDVAACAAHLARAEDARCMDFGCLARRACPVGREFAHEPAQAAFHMAAFRDARQDAGIATATGAGSVTACRETRS